MKKYLPLLLLPLFAAPTAAKELKTLHEKTLYAIGIQLGGIMRDLTGSYDLPFTIAALLLVAASLVAFSIQEKRFSSRYQVASGAPLPQPGSLP